MFMVSGFDSNFLLVYAKKHYWHLSRARCKSLYIVGGYSWVTIIDRLFDSLDYLGYARAHDQPQLSLDYEGIELGRDGTVTYIPTTIIEREHTWVLPLRLLGASMFDLRGRENEVTLREVLQSDMTTSYNSVSTFARTLTPCVSITEFVLAKFSMSSTQKWQHASEKY